MEDSFMLLENCPDCGASLFAYLYTPCGDHPEIAVYNVECCVCDYKHDDTYPNIEYLNKEFTTIKQPKNLHRNLHHVFCACGHDECNIGMRIDTNPLTLFLTDKFGNDTAMKVNQQTIDDLDQMLKTMKREYKLQNKRK